MQRSLIRCFRLTNLRVFYGIMAVVVPFYMLFSHRGYLSMYRFLRHRLGYSRFKSFVGVYVNHYRFGQIILDRFAVYSGKRFEFNVEGYEYYEALLSGESGFIQISSHVGNYELAGYSLSAKNKRMNALVFSGETETVMENRNKILSRNNVRMVPIREDLSHIFLLNSALAEGEIVSMPGDRVYGSPKYVDCLFFGEAAKFPLGPFAMAVQREVPVLTVFVMKTSTYGYNVHVRPLEQTWGEDTPRRDRMALYAKAFARELEAIVRHYPAQWFNYYDFWQHDDE